LPLELPPPGQLLTGSVFEVVLHRAAVLLLPLTARTGFMQGLYVKLLPVPDLPPGVPRVAQDRRHRAQRPHRTTTVRISARVSSRRTWDPSVVLGAGDPGYAVPGQALSLYPPRDRRGHRLAFQPVRPAGDVPPVYLALTSRRPASWRLEDHQLRRTSSSPRTRSASAQPSWVPAR